MEAFRFAVCAIFAKFCVELLDTIALDAIKRITVNAYGSFLFFFCFF